MDLRPGIRVQREFLVHGARRRSGRATVVYTRDNHDEMSAGNDRQVVLLLRWHKSRGKELSRGEHLGQVLFLFDRVQPAGCRESTVSNGDGGRRIEHGTKHRETVERWDRSEGKRELDACILFEREARVGRLPHLVQRFRVRERAWPNEGRRGGGEKLQVGNSAVAATEIELCRRDWEDDGEQQVREIAGAGRRKIGIER